MKLQCQRMTSPKGSFNKMAACVLTWERVRERARKGGGEKKKRRKKRRKKKKNVSSTTTDLFRHHPLLFLFSRRKEVLWHQGPLFTRCAKGVLGCCGGAFGKKVLFQRCLWGFCFFQNSTHHFFLPRQCLDLSTDTILFITPEIWIYQWIALLLGIRAI